MSEFKLGPNQEKWLAALESGEYRQCSDEMICGQGINVSYCCLGVANKVLALREKSRQVLATTYDKIGLRDCNGKFTRRRRISHYPVSFETLTAANDAGATFAEIAAFIRANPEVVFTEPK